MGANQSKTIEARVVTDQEITTSYLKQGKQHMGPHFHLNAEHQRIIINHYRTAVLNGIMPWNAALYSWWAEFPKNSRMA